MLSDPCTKIFFEIIQFQLNQKAIYVSSKKIKKKKNSRSWDFEGRQRKHIWEDKKCNLSIIENTTVNNVKVTNVGVCDDNSPDTQDLKKLVPGIKLLWVTGRLNDKREKQSHNFIIL